ncbi:unnamed protein product [Symbiodinium sp. CCMP2456]|nr:unnamed protein product [Symbiodinium sp. CCMP2456]
MLAGAKRSRTQAGLVEEIRNCVNEFPEDATEGKISEIADFVQFCTRRDSVDKLVQAITCNADMQSLINTIDIADPAAVQKLRALVSAATADIINHLQPTLALLERSLNPNEVATPVPGAFKGIWKLARVCKAREGFKFRSGTALDDAQSVAHSVAALERDIDADKFVKTATAVQKLSASRDLKTACEWVDAAGIQLNPWFWLEYLIRNFPYHETLECHAHYQFSFLQGSDIDGGLVKLKQAIARVAASHISETPAWMWSLIHAGKHTPVMALDSSAKSRLGPQVEKIIRGVQRVKDFSAPAESINHGIYTAEAWTSANLAMEGMTAWCDVTAFQRDHKEQGLHGLEAAVTGLTDKVTSSIIHLANKAKAGKAALQPVYEEVKLALPFLQGVDVAKVKPEDVPQEVTTLLTKYADEPETLEGAVAGAKAMRDTEYVLQCYINRESDMTDTIPAETLKIMTEAYKLGPTCSEMMAATFAFMSLELFTQDRSEPARLAKDVTAFLKFASTHLLLTRKDQPAKAVALLEKMQKAGWSQVHVMRKSIAVCS